MKGITIFIGSEDIQEWVQNKGKPILMPQLFNALKNLYKDDDSESQIAARVKCKINKSHHSFDFIVTKENSDDTISKIMEWAIEEEEYELCSEIQKFKEKIYQF